MKRYVYAGSAVTLTGVLVMLAIAVAQRDARIEDSATNEAALPYANQTAQPIAISGEEFAASAESPTQTWPPAPPGIAPPIVRANDMQGGPPSEANYPLPASTRASLVSYAPTGDQPPPSGRLAEPPPLADLNSFSPGLPSALPQSVPGPLPSAGNAQGAMSRLSDRDEPPALGNGPLTGASLPALPNSSMSEAQPSIGATSPSLTATGPGLPSAAYTPGPSASQGGYPGEPANSPFAAPAIPNPIGSAYGGANALPSTSQSPASLPPQNASQVKPVSASPPTSLSSGGNSLPSRLDASTQPPVATFGSPIAPANEVPEPRRAPSSSNMDVNAMNAQAFSSPAPGTRQLDGSQNPSMEIQKRAPTEVQVGIPATFTLLVRNVGNATAFNVKVTDSVPKGAKLVRTSPPAQVSADQALVWKLGEMAAGSEQVLTIELVPETEGEIGSVASVDFAAQASVRTMSTQPKLVVKQIFEPVVLASESVRILIEVSNAGSGTARNVRLQEDVPANLRHETGSQLLQRELGDMAPGEVQKLDIDLTAIAAGKVSNMLKVVADNAGPNESSATIEVVAPKLELAIEGAGLRYLERQVTYRIAAVNSGSAIATNVELVLYLPSGMQFNSTINKGSYLPSQHAVRWELDELAAGGSAVTEVTLLPVEEGNFVLRLQSTADNIRAQPLEKAVRVEGQSELSFSIEDDNDPIEVDGRTTYIVKVVNIGTRADHNVELLVDLPEGVTVEQVNAPVEYKVAQRSLVFAPIPQLQAKDQQSIRFAVRHSRDGIHVVRAQLRSKLRPIPVSKEESTEVYRDR